MLRIWSTVVYVGPRRRRVVRAARVGRARDPGRCRDRPAHARDAAAQGGRRPRLRPRGAARTTASTPTSWRGCASCSRSRCSVVERLQTTLHPVSAYVVLPVFALANAGVELGRRSARSFTEPVGARHRAGPGARQAGRHLRWRRSWPYASGSAGCPSTPRGRWSSGSAPWPASASRSRSSSPGCRSRAPTLLTDEAKIAILLASLFAAVVGVAAAARRDARPVGSRR